MKLTIEGTVKQWGQSRVTLGTEAGKIDIALAPKDMSAWRKSNPQKISVTLDDGKEEKVDAPADHADATPS